MKYRFGIIGFGRLGSAMFTLLQEAGHVPAWVVSSKKIALDVPVHEEIPDMPEEADLVLLSVPDGQIRRTAGLIAGSWGSSCRDRVFFHFSGLLTSEELAPLSGQGGLTASLHPLQSITDPETAGPALRNCIFTVEGMDEARNAAREIVDAAGAVLIPIAMEDKVLYHASAVVASNYLAALLNQASEIISPVGLSLEHLMPLVKGTVSNVEKKGRSALTGPISRGDWSTVKAHLDALGRSFPDLLPSYVTLGRYTARMACREWPHDFGRTPKLAPIGPLLRMLDAERDRGMKIVFTNGCFDIIHAGHVSYLEKARTLGDCLVVGLNSDSSVKKIKGPDRPVNDERARASVLAAFSCIDHVTVFQEETPLELIKKVRPAVLVKGGDWAVENIVGAGFVKSMGGEVRTIPFEEGFSTTGIIEKIKS
jgi:rfaE bifunctional protein nucleotidyltransferase chain/domain